MYFSVCGLLHFKRTLIPDAEVDSSNSGAESLFTETSSISEEAELSKIEVKPKAWLCEPALWTTWVHKGDLVAFTESDIVAIHTGKFGEVVQENPELHGAIAAYARGFVDMLAEFDKEHLSDIFEGAGRVPIDYRYLNHILECSLTGESTPSLDNWRALHKRSSAVWSWSATDSYSPAIVGRSLMARMRAHFLPNTTDLGQHPR